jgi:hypothetical protein
VIDAVVSCTVVVHLPGKHALSCTMKIAQRCAVDDLRMCAPTAFVAGLAVDVAPSER